MSDQTKKARGWGFGGQVYKGSSVEWYTPSGDLQGPRLTRHYSIAEDGLALPWAGRVWLNPPYGRESAEWVDRLAAHGDGVALVFARTDTAWGQRNIAAADAVCLIAGRLSFVPGPSASQPKGHNAGAPSMLLGFGETCASAVLACRLGLTFVADNCDCLELVA